MLALTLAGKAGWATAQSAKSYPSGPVTIVLPFAAGSAADDMTRLCSKTLSSSLGQSFIVENVSGASGTIGTGRVERAAPDGANLVVASAATVTVAPYLFAHLPYDPGKLVPIATMGDSPIVVVVPAKSKIRSLVELVQAAKSSPGKLSFGSGGVGSAAHIAGAVFEWKTGTQLTHVPYRGVAASVPDLVSARLDVLFVSYPAVRPMVQSGALRVLAVASAARSDMVGENIPTAAQAGVADYVQSAWNGLMGPPGLSHEVVTKLNNAVNAFLRAPDTVKALAGLGMVPIPNTPAAFAKRIADERAQMQALMKTMSITPT